MKRYLKRVRGKNEDDLTVNNIFRMMENYKFIRSWEAWRKYYEYRNNTSHEYDKEKAQELISKIDGFIEECEYFYKKLSEALENDSRS
jgi:DNA-binding transcriptional regulator YhcF (GntR family)